MKLETEVDSSLCLFSSPERKGTCTGRSADESTAAVAEQLSAQDRPASIAAADTLLAAGNQLTASHQLPSRCGCGSVGTGFKATCSTRESSSIAASCCVHHPDQKGSSLAPPASEEGERNGAVDTWDISQLSRACRDTGDVGSQPPAITALQCEHFQYIDDEDDEEEEVEMFVRADDTTKCNGHQDEVPSVKLNGDLLSAGRHLQDDERSEEVSDPAFVYDSSELDDRETAVFLVSSSRDVVNEMDEASTEKESNHDTADTVPFVITGGERECGLRSSPPNAITDTKELRSVLKKGKCNNSGKKCRVTFDEAVTLYSDERPDVQLLALRSADISCADVFYMFEPPIEYQDLLPFEPPAEYRDPDDEASENQYEIFYAATQQHPETDDAEEKEVGGDNEQSYNCEKSDEACLRTDNGIEIKGDEDGGDFGLVPTDGGDSAGVAMATVQSEEDARDDCGGVQEATKGYVEFTESDKLFERFLEAEREFSEDEELNSVFRVLEGDLAAEGKNGAFDDNFFRKLINLLSSVEGDVHLEDGEFFSSTDFTVDDEDANRDTEEDESGQTPSRTLSEADSDCSISSQDTIIVRLGEEDQDSTQGTLHKLSSDGDLSLEDVSNQELIEGSCDDLAKQGGCDEVFSEDLQKNSEEGLSKKPRPLLHEIGRSPQTSLEKSNGGESLSRQSSGEQPQSGTSQDPVQDADDSTSSDSRSGEVEEDIRHDDIGYDEEDAEDYDEECLRGNVQGNSKIRRIIKKNALQCTLLRGIEARRRQPGVKYPRPKSPLPSRDSLVEQLRWLTTLDEGGEVDTAMLHSKAPDVILSTGNVHLNGALPHSTSSEEEAGVNGRSLLHPRLPPLHPTQQRHLVTTDNNGVYIVHPGGFVPQQQPPPLRQWIAPVGQHPQMAQHHLPQYSPPHPMPHPQMQQPEQRVVATVTVPRDFRDWRVIQRVVVNRGGGGATDGRVQSHFPAGFSAVRQCPNGSVNAYQTLNPPDVSRVDERTKQISGHDELEQFVQQDIQRIERIRQRYSLAEDDDDPTFGFARRPSVRGIQNRFGHPAAFMNHVNNSGQPPVVSGIGQKRLTNRLNTSYANFDESVQGPVVMHARAAPDSGQPPKVWSRPQTWQMDATGQTPVYGRSQPPLHIHRASVALSELPGSATLPHAHPNSIADTRYHSYAENMYGTARILNPQGWPSKTVRTCITPSTAAPHALQVPLVGAPLVSPPPALQVPPHPLSAGIKDERGVPEGASSSPKVSSDSLYHGPVLDSIPVADTHSNDGVIYYSLNV